jgi:hypothetical protein
VCWTWAHPQLEASALREGTLDFTCPLGAFFNDARDKIALSESTSSLSAKARVALAFKTDRELIVDFALL